MAVPLHIDWASRLDRKGCALSGVKREMGRSGKLLGKKQVVVKFALSRKRVLFLSSLLECVSVGGEVGGMDGVGVRARKNPLEADVMESSCVGTEQQRALLTCMLWSLCFMRGEEAGWGLEVRNGTSNTAEWTHFSVEMSKKWFALLEDVAKRAYLPLEKMIGALIERGLEELESNKEEALQRLYWWQAACGCMTIRNFYRWGFQWWVEALQSNNPVGWWGSRYFVFPQPAISAYSQSQTPFSTLTPPPPSNIYDGIELFPYIVLQNAECFAQDFVHCATNRARYDVKSKAGQPARNKRLAEARKQAKLMG